MLNDTQKGLLDEFIDDYFMKAAKVSFNIQVQSAGKFGRGKIRSVRDD